MARIFYYSDTGNVYGVHPGPHEGDELITLPADVIWIDVPTPSDQIVWPQLPDGSAGSEEFSRVNFTKNIVRRIDVVFPPPPLLTIEDLYDMLATKGTLDDDDRPPNKPRPLKET